jgi:hypothetical protein
VNQPIFNTAVRNQPRVCFCSYFGSVKLAAERQAQGEFSERMDLDFEFGGCGAGLGGGVFRTGRSASRRSASRA